MPSSRYSECAGGEMRKTLVMLLSLSVLYPFRLLSPFSLPASAREIPIPLWANLIADANCRYLSVGATWDAALNQAIVDNAHWASEFSVNVDASSVVIFYAVRRRCPDLMDDAWEKRERETRERREYMKQNSASVDVI